MKTDRTIQEYTKEANQNSPDAEHLNAAKRGFQTALVQDLFDLTDIERRFFQFRKILRDNSNTITHFVLDETEKLFQRFSRTQRESYRALQTTITAVCANRHLARNARRVARSDQTRCALFCAEVGGGIVAQFV
ncbi:MAG: hypothetical protein U0T32_01420 [Chitinophagales bacterium]